MFGHEDRSPELRERLEVCGEALGAVLVVTHVDDVELLAIAAVASDGVVPGPDREVTDEHLDGTGVVEAPDQDGVHVHVVLQYLLGWRNCRKSTNS